MNFPGIYFDGRTPTRQAVLVAPRREGLAIIDLETRQEIAFWPYPAVERVADEDGATATRLACGGARLRVDGAPFIAALGQSAPALVERSRRHRLLRSLAIVALTALVGLGGYLVLPRLDAPIAALLPASWEKRLARRTVDIMAGRICTGEKGQAALDRLVGRLVDGVELPTPLAVQVSARDDINAFAAPGGRIILLNGLITAAASADEVAGVLAHEITHSRRRHPTRLIIRQSETAFLEQLLLGTDAGGMSQMLILLSYSRQFEREADEGAIELLTKAKIDTAPFGAFFTRMTAERHGQAAPTILVTHPPPEERSAMIAAHPVASPRPALSDEDWQALRAICNEN
jgi:predicted Zn-dependent protease